MSAWHLWWHSLWLRLHERMVSTRDPYDYVVLFNIRRTLLIAFSFQVWNELRPSYLQHRLLHHTRQLHGPWRLRLCLGMDGLRLRHVPGQLQYQLKLHCDLLVGYLNTHTRSLPFSRPLAVCKAHAIRPVNASATPATLAPFVTLLFAPLGKK